MNTENDWAECLTVEQLKTIWEPAAEGTVTNWNQVDPSFPDEPLELFGAGTDSGTFDYFTDAINGEEGASRTDYSATEDDNVTVQGVSGVQGRPRLLRPLLLRGEQGQAQGVEVDGGDGCVAPTTETVQDGTYTPLSPAAVHLPDAGAARTTPRARRSSSSTSSNATTIAETALFVPLTAEQQQTARSTRSRRWQGGNDADDLARWPSTGHAPTMTHDPRRGRVRPGESWLRGDPPRTASKVVGAARSSCALLSVVTTVGIVVVADPADGRVLRRGRARASSSPGPSGRRSFTDPRASGCCRSWRARSSPPCRALVVCDPVRPRHRDLPERVRAARASRDVLKPVLEVLAGIPTVVYGFFALKFVSPTSRTSGRSATARRLQRVVGRPRDGRS